MTGDKHYWDVPLKSRLHVLHVSRSTTEGIAVVVLGYVREQLERGWNVTVVCPSDGWLGYEARKLGARVRWWSAERSPTRGVPRESFLLSSIVRKSAPHVVHLHGAKAGLVGRLVVRGSIPTVYQPHGWSFLAAGSARILRASVAWERWATRWTSVLVCVSEDERTVAGTHRVECAALTLPNGVDLARWPLQGATERRHARDRLGMGEEPVVCCVGRLAPQKGQQDLLDAWPTVRARVPDARLVLIGDGPDRAALSKRADEMSGVQLVGARTDVLTWMAATNVVAVPSRWEGMALVPLESMSAGRSVVASCATGMVESVPTGAGAIVAPADVEALADALVHRLRHRAEADAEGLVGHEHVRAHHDAATPARALSGEYLRLVAVARR